MFHPDRKAKTFTGPEDPLPWSDFLQECVVPAFAALKASGVRPFPDITKGEDMECCSSCSHRTVGKLTDAAYLFFHSQNVSEEAMGKLTYERDVYAEDADFENDNPEPVVQGRFKATIEDYAALDYMMKSDPSLYLGHSFDWPSVAESSSELPLDARAAVRILGAYGEVDWNNSPSQCIAFKPFTHRDWDLRKHPLATVKLALDAMWRLRSGNLSIGCRTTLPVTKKMTDEKDEKWVGIILNITSQDLKEYILQFV
mmetsp:Transcript_10115/g.18335  ORF Transcript_10115/g.18335 Transcript_10115/m.18335 type:complete len:256 (+) Transcript_10115:890-1657(+)